MAHFQTSISIADSDTCAPPTFYFRGRFIIENGKDHNELLKIRTASREADNRLYRRGSPSRAGFRSIVGCKSSGHIDLVYPLRSPRLVFIRNALTGNAINRIREYARIQVQRIPRIRLMKLVLASRRAHVAAH